MTETLQIRFAESDADAIAETEGRLACLMGADGSLGAPARRVNRLTRGALKRLGESEAFAALKPGEGTRLALPAGLAAEALFVVKLDRRASQAEARAAGASLAKFKEMAPLTVLAGNLQRVGDLALGLQLRSYAFTAHKTDEASGKANAPATITLDDPGRVTAEAADAAALAEGVAFARDLTNEPANVLTTETFADRLAEMAALGLKVEVLDEPALETLGMRTLLAVGQGSASPSKVVVMRWEGGEAGAAPLAVCGKGVVFDTGGISLKPPGGMEEMTADMGGAGVVSGLMRALALRKAKANVVGLVGLVENMPGAAAQRPGDVVRSMKGDTVEVINTDAEGRLVLADVLWHAQTAFEPAALIDLATLTGAIVVALGNQNAGVFSNDDALADAFLAAAASEEEGAWRMPLDPAYGKLLKSRVADVANVGGRAAGAVTAAKFLERFVKDDMPWIHLDIAGVALVKEATAFAPKGATGWGVRSLDRLIRTRFEG